MPEPTSEVQTTTPVGQPVTQSTVTTAQAEPARESVPANGSIDSTPEGVKVQADGKVQMLSQSAYKRLKEQAKSKGAKEALFEQAKKHGYNTVDTYLAAVDAALGLGKQEPKRQDKAAVPVERQDPGPAPSHLSEKQAHAWNKERSKINGELEKTKKERAHYEKKYRQERQAREQTETEMALREAAILSGCKDPDYAVRLLERSVSGKDEEALKSFDEKKFFSGLKETHPYLFGEVSRPATTGHAASAAPAMPKANQGSVPEFVDAMKLKSEDFHSLLRRRGWNPNA